MPTVLSALSGGLVAAQVLMSHAIVPKSEVRVLVAEVDLRVGTRLHPGDFQWESSNEKPEAGWVSERNHHLIWGATLRDSLTAGEKLSLDKIDFRKAQAPTRRNRARRGMDIIQDEGES